MIWECLSIFGLACCQPVHPLLNRMTQHFAPLITESVSLAKPGRPRNGMCGDGQQGLSQRDAYRRQESVARNGIADYRTRWSFRFIRMGIQMSAPLDDITGGGVIPSVQAAAKLRAIPGDEGERHYGFFIKIGGWFVLSSESLNRFEMSLVVFISETCLSHATP